MRRWGLVVWIVLVSAATNARAAETANKIDGSALSLAWGLPFVGILLSIALFPLLAAKTWEHHFGKIAAFWAAAFLVPCAARFGVGTAGHELLHTALIEYLPFIILLFALFVVAGGVNIVGNLIGNPNTNTAMLAFGTLSASVLGTTGASMVLIRPMIRANADRHHNVHVFIFFIFLVSNIGGSLTPVGDPPLFLGFLKGVDFLWTVTTMFGPMAVTSGVLLVVFFCIDHWMWRHEPRHWMESRVPRQVRIQGLQNVVYLTGVVGAVLASGVWDSGVIINVAGIGMPLTGLLRDAVLLLLAYLSWTTTPSKIRVENAFAWTPIQEVAMLFAGIFITIIPVLAMLKAGREGALAPVLTIISTSDGQPVNAAYFWMAGILSSFLDNAPTYLVFFNLAGGDAEVLMGPLAETLLAISAGAVFMGANTYIGNAPNFMVKAICEERGIPMPSFFGYMLWSGVILLPLFAVVTWLFFR